MNKPEQHLKRIQDKVQRLLKQHIALQKENEALKTEIDQLKNEANQFRESTTSLQQQLEIMKFSNGEMDPGEKKQFEKRINGYIREIDRAIAMLGK